MATGAAPITAGSGTPVAVDIVAENLTGTVSKAGTTALTGSSTLFLSELIVGGVVRVPGTTTEDRVITAIASDTALTVSVAFVNTASGQTGQRVSEIQKVKIIDPAVGSVVGLGIVTNPMNVTLIGSGITSRVTATSAGLTTATTAYVAGDMLGTEMSLLSMARVSGGRGVIESVSVTDANNIIGAVDVLFFSATSGQAADNAAASWSDANILNQVGYAQMPTPMAYALNRVTYLPTAIPYQCAATTLFASIITRTGHTFFGAVGDITLAVQIRQE